MYIYSSTYDFLRDLRVNNNRDWFQANKERYDSAHKNIKDFIAAIILRLSDLDPHINTEINPAKCLFRIYRDVRFAKDKSPYKSWFAAGISVDGRKLDGPEYYLHIEPENSYIACGYWQPKKEHLDAIRQEIDYNGQAFHEALAYGSWDEKHIWSEDRLVRPPAGYTEDNPNIEFLKLKSFIIQVKLEDDVLKDEHALESIMQVCEKVGPFKNFLHDAIDG